MTLGLIDYGSGNFGSVRNALEHLKIDVRGVDHPEGMRSVDRLILPGVGAFASAMRRLESSGLADALRESVEHRKIPILGICVGMQVMASIGREFEDYPGFGWIGGDVERIRVDEEGPKLPHMGWNEVELNRSHPIFDGMNTPPIFYFVHSYHLSPRQPTDVLATCRHGNEVVAAVARDNIVGVQFHPEKSQRDGLRLLKNFADWSPN